MRVRTLTLLIASLALPTVGTSNVLIDFDDMSGVIGDFYRAQGATFTLGDAQGGASTIDTGVSAFSGDFGTSISANNVLVPAPRTNTDVYVNFFTSTGRGTVDFVSLTNDTEGDPQVVLQAFDANGVLLGQTDFLAAGERGSLMLTGIAYARIIGQPVSAGGFGIDDFEFSQPVPEPASMIALGTGAFALLRKRRAR